MKFLKWNIGDKSALLKAMQESFDNMNNGIDPLLPRPTTDQRVMTKETGAQIPIHPFPMFMLYDLAKDRDSVRVPLEILRRELFRNGLEITERYKYKCLNCGKEFQSKPEDADTREVLCDTCGSDQLVRPAPEHRKYLDRLLTDAVNENGQSLYDVLYEIEWDLDVADNGCVLLLKDYYMDGVTKKLLNKTPKAPIPEGDDITNKEEDTEEDVFKGFKEKVEKKDPKEESDEEENPEKEKDPLSDDDVPSEIDGEVEDQDGDGDIDKVDVRAESFDTTNIKEIMRVAPHQVMLIADQRGRLGFRSAGSNGNQYGVGQNTTGMNSGSVDQESKQVYVCPFHRNMLSYAEECQSCGSECLKAIVEVSNIYGAIFNNGSDSTASLFFGEGEVIFGSKYLPSILYGYSPLYALYTKIMTLHGMDTYLMHYFDKFRPPKGLLFVNTRNFESLYSTWKKILDKNKENPHEIHPIAIESDKTGKQMVQFIDLMRTLEEMEYVDARNEMRRIISTMYGVSPLFGGEVKGGITNESLQVTITNRAMEFGQATLQNRFLNKLTKMLGINDWVIRFRPAEVIDKLRELQIRAQEIDNASKLQTMGFEVKMSHTGEFIFSKEPVNKGMMNPAGDPFGDPMGEKQQSHADASSPKEKQTNFDGEPLKQRSSDKGGTADGSPTSGTNTSFSNKAEPKKRGRPRKV